MRFVDNTDAPRPPGWQVGQLADAAGLTVAVLHHYEQDGLVSPSVRSTDGRRLFSDEDVRQLYRIRALQELGVRPGDLGPALDRDLHELFREHLRLVEMRLESLTFLRDSLRSACDRLEAPAADALLSMLEAMAVAARSSDSSDGAGGWRALSNELRACLDAGDDPTAPHVQELAIRARERIDEQAEQPPVPEALAYLRRGVPTFDHPGWDLPLMRYLNSALIALDERQART